MQQLKRLGIVILSLIALIFIPYYLGIFATKDINEKFNIVYIYSLGMLLTVTFFIAFLIISLLILRIYNYIKYGTL